jgi:hypothetical protein
LNGGIGGFAGPNDLGKPEATLGGYGSGWQGSKKATVEGSLVLTASALVRKKALVPGAKSNYCVQDAEPVAHQTTAQLGSSMTARIPTAAVFRSAPRAASTTCQAPRWTLPA